MHVWIFWVWGWVGVGAGWDVSVHCNCNHTLRSFSCTSTVASCYAAARSLAHLHITSCYAAARSFALPHWTSCYAAARFLHVRTCVMLRCCTLCCASTHYVMLRCCTFSCASTDMSCYAVARSLALPRVCHATNQNSFVCWWLQSLERNLQATSARKTLQMAKFCPQPGWVCKALGEETHEKKIVIGRNTDFRQTVGLVKNTIPWQFNTHIDCGQDFRKDWKYLCMTQSGARASKAMPWTTSDNFVLERKKRNFFAKPSANTTPVSHM